MASSSPLTFICCCKSRWCSSSSSAPAMQEATALQPLPALSLPLEGHEEESGPKHQGTLIGLSDMAWAVPAYQSSMESDTITNQHTDSDSDSFASDRDLSHSTKKCSTAFGAVRNRLIRSISHNTSSDQPTRVSVGNSEEEVARRAELRRIMRLRIQDQLESDEAEDQFEHKPTNSARGVASFADIALPISGPRDAIEFGVSNSSSNNGQSAQLNPERDQSITPQGLEGLQRNTTISEKISSEGPGVVGRRDDSCEDIVIRRPSPIHLAAHISLTGDVGLPPSQKSFQLSNSSGRLDRILGPESRFNSRQASSGDGQSALGVWLIAQGLRSRDNSIIFFVEDQAETTNVAEVAAYNSPAVDLEKSSLSYQTLAASEKRVCVAQGSTPINSSRKLDVKCQLKPDSPKDLHDNSTFSGESPWGPTVRIFLNSFTDNTSSSDPSKSPPSPVRSRMNLYKLELKDLESMELSPFRWQSRDSPQDQDNLNNENHNLPYTAATHFKSRSQGIISNIQPGAATIHDAASIAQLESASFVQREAELGTIERRFSEALTPKRPGKTVLTRFHEDFAARNPQSSGKKPSRCNIYLAIPASHFRAKSEDSLYQHGKDRQGIPRTRKSLLVPVEQKKVYEKEASGRSKRRSNLSIRPHMSRLPTEEYVNSSLERQESATDLWQRAVRLEAESRHSSSFFNTPNPDQRSLASNRSPKRTVAARNSNNSIYDVRRETSQLTPSTDERSSPSNSKWLIERWVSQMRPKSAHPTESVTSVRLVGPPRSWSKFPSFNREERNRNVTPKDKVQPRDFAVKHVTSEGQIRWATDMASGENEQRAHTLPRSLSIKFGKLVKSKMNRVIPSKALRHRVSQAFIARPVTSGSAHMEYPEMGIRPSESGYTEIQALGREINHMKGQTHLQTLGKDLSKPNSSRSLGDRVVALMHEAIGQRHPKQDEPLQSVDIPLVPVTPSLVRQSIAATTTDVFVTPKSHLSNDDESDEEKDEAEAGFIKVREPETCPMMFDDDRAAAPITKVDDRTHSTPKSMTPNRLGAAEEE